MAFAAPAAVLALPVDAQTELLREPALLEVPASAATVREVRRGDGRSLVIHIQDAHSNVSGQINLAETLEALMKRYRVRLILSEGGSQDCTLTPIKSVATPEAWKRIAKKYVMAGKISGEEYLNLVSPMPMKIIGLEDEKLYMDNVRAYAALADGREATLSYIERIRSGVEKLKRRSYPKELLEYEESKAEKGSGGEDSFRFLLKLASAAEIDVSKWPNAEQLVELQLEEALVDFRLANLESAALIEELDRRGAGKDLKESLERLGAARGEKLSEYAHFQNTFIIAEKNNVSLSPYPNLRRYVSYLSRFASLDLEKLSEELEALEEELYAKLCTAAGARLVRTSDRFLESLRTAYEIRLTNREFGFLKANEPEIRTVPMLAFLNRSLADAGYIGDTTSYEPLLENGREALGRFYDSVAARDVAFVANAEAAMKAEKESVAVLISGGYHTPHLMQLLSERGHSIVVVTPVVTSETNQKRYEDGLLAAVGRKSSVKKQYARREATLEDLRQRLTVEEARVSRTTGSGTSASTLERMAQEAAALAGKEPLGARAAVAQFVASQEAPTGLSPEGLYGTQSGLEGARLANQPSGTPKPVKEAGPLVGRSQGSFREALEEYFENRDSYVQELKGKQASGDEKERIDRLRDLDAYKKEYGHLAIYYLIKHVKVDLGLFNKPVSPEIKIGGISVQQLQADKFFVLQETLQSAYLSDQLEGYSGLGNLGKIVREFREKLREKNLDTTVHLGHLTSLLNSRKKVAALLGIGEEDPAVSGWDMPKVDLTWEHFEAITEYLREKNTEKKLLEYTGEEGLLRLLTEIKQSPSGPLSKLKGIHLGQLTGLINSRKKVAALLGISHEDAELKEWSLPYRNITWDEYWEGQSSTQASGVRLAAKNTTPTSAELSPEDPKGGRLAKQGSGRRALRNAGRQILFNALVGLDRVDRWIRSRRVLYSAAPFLASGVAIGIYTTLGVHTFSFILASLAAAPIAVFVLMKIPDKHYNRRRGLLSLTASLVLSVAVGCPVLRPAESNNLPATAPITQTTVPALEPTIQEPEKKFFAWYDVVRSGATDQLPDARVRRIYQRASSILSVLRETESRMYSNESALERDRRIDAILRAAILIWQFENPFDEETDSLIGSFQFEPETVLDIIRRSFGEIKESDGFEALWVYLNQGTEFSELVRQAMKPQGERAEALASTKSILDGNEKLQAQFLRFLLYFKIGDKALFEDSWIGIYARDYNTAYFERSFPKLIAGDGAGQVSQGLAIESRVEATALPLNALFSVESASDVENAFRLYKKRESDTNRLLAVYEQVTAATTYLRGLHTRYARITNRIRFAESAGMLLRPKTQGMYLLKKREILAELRGYSDPSHPLARAGVLRERLKGVAWEGLTSEEVAKSLAGLDRALSELQKGYESLQGLSSGGRLAESPGLIEESVREWVLRESAGDEGFLGELERIPDRHEPGVKIRVSAKDAEAISLILDDVFRYTNSFRTDPQHTRIVFLKAGADPLADLARAQARMTGSFPEENIHSVWATMGQYRAMKDDPEQAVLSIKYLADEGVLGPDTQRIIFVDTDTGGLSVISEENAPLTYGTELFFWKTLLDPQVIEKANRRYDLNLKPLNQGTEAPQFHLYYLDAGAYFGMGDKRLLARSLKGEGVKEGPGELVRKLGMHSPNQPRTLQTDLRKKIEVWPVIDNLIKVESIESKLIEASSRRAAPVVKPAYGQPFEGDRLRIAWVYSRAMLMAEFLKGLRQRGYDTAGEERGYLERLGVTQSHVEPAVPTGWLFASERRNILFGLISTTTFLLSTGLLLDSYGYVPDSRLFLLTSASAAAFMMGLEFLHILSGREQFYYFLTFLRPIITHLMPHIFKQMEPFENAIRYGLPENLKINIDELEDLNDEEDALRGQILKELSGESQEESSLEYRWVSLRFGAESMLERMARFLAIDPAILNLQDLVGGSSLGRFLSGKSVFSKNPNFTGDEELVLALRRVFGLEDYPLPQGWEEAEGSSGRGARLAKIAPMEKGHIRTYSREDGFVGISVPETEARDGYFRLGDYYFSPETDPEKLSTLGIPQEAVQEGRVSRILPASNRYSRNGNNFGYGDFTKHAVTQMIRHREVIQGNAFIDIGSGFGDLLFLAERLGAKSIQGIEIDPNFAERLHNKIIGSDLKIKPVIHTGDAIEILPQILASLKAQGYARPVITLNLGSGIKDHPGKGGFAGLLESDFPNRLYSVDGVKPIFIYTGAFSGFQWGDGETEDRTPSLLDERLDDFLARIGSRERDQLRSEKNFLRDDEGPVSYGFTLYPNEYVSLESLLSGSRLASVEPISMSLLRPIPSLIKRILIELQIKFYIHQLRHGRSWRDRAVAARQLDGDAYRKAGPDLLNILTQAAQEEWSSEVLADVIYSLGRMHYQPALDAILQIAALPEYSDAKKYSDKQVASMAVDAFANLSSVRAIDILESYATTHPNSDVRAESVEALAKISIGNETDRAVRQRAILLARKVAETDSESYVRERAAVALKDLERTVLLPASLWGAGDLAHDLAVGATHSTSPAYLSSSDERLAEDLGMSAGDIQQIREAIDRRIYPGKRGRIVESVRQEVLVSATRGLGHVSMEQRLAHVEGLQIYSVGWLGTVAGLIQTRGSLKEEAAKQFGIPPERKWLLVPMVGIYAIMAMLMAGAIHHTVTKDGAASSAIMLRDMDLLSVGRETTHELAHARKIYSGPNAFLSLREEEGLDKPKPFDHLMLLPLMFFKNIGGLACAILFGVVDWTVFGFVNRTVFHNNQFLESISEYVFIGALLILWVKFLFVINRRDSSEIGVSTNSKEYQRLRRQANEWVEAMADGSVRSQVSPRELRWAYMGEEEAERFWSYAEAWKAAAIASGFAEANGLPRQAAYDILALNVTRVDELQKNVALRPLPLYEACLKVREIYRKGQASSSGGRLAAGTEETDKAIKPKRGDIVHSEQHGRGKIISVTMRRDAATNRLEEVIVAEFGKNQRIFPISALGPQGNLTYLGRESSLLTKAKLAETIEAPWYADGGIQIHRLSEHLLEVVRSSVPEKDREKVLAVLPAGSMLYLSDRNGFISRATVEALVNDLDVEIVMSGPSDEFVDDVAQMFILPAIKSYLSENGVNLKVNYDPIVSSTVSEISARWADDLVGLYNQQIGTSVSGYASKIVDFKEENTGDGRRRIRAKEYLKWAQMTALPGVWEHLRELNRAENPLGYLLENFPSDQEAFTPFNKVYQDKEPFRARVMDWIHARYPNLNETAGGRLARAPEELTRSPHAKGARLAAIQAAPDASKAWEGLRQDLWPAVESAAKSSASTDAGEWVETGQALRRAWGEAGFDGRVLAEGLAGLNSEFLEDRHFLEAERIVRELAGLRHEAASVSDWAPRAPLATMRRLQPASGEQLEASDWRHVLDYAMNRVSVLIDHVRTYGPHFTTLLEPTVPLGAQGRSTALPVGGIGKPIDHELMLDYAKLLISIRFSAPDEVLNTTTLDGTTYREEIDRLLSMAAEPANFNAEASPRYPGNPHFIRQEWGESPAEAFKINFRRLVTGNAYIAADGRYESRWISEEEVEAVVSGEFSGEDAVSDGAEGSRMASGRTVRDGRERKAFERSTIPADVPTLVESVDPAVRAEVAEAFRYSQAFSEEGLAEIARIAGRLEQKERKRFLTNVSLATRSDGILEEDLPFIGRVIGLLGAEGAEHVMRLRYRLAEHGEEAREAWRNLARLAERFAGRPGSFEDLWVQELHGDAEALLGNAFEELLEREVRYRAVSARIRRMLDTFLRRRERAMDFDAAFRLAAERLPRMLRSQDVRRYTRENGLYFFQSGSLEEHLARLSEVGKESLARRVDEGVAAHGFRDRRQALEAAYFVSSLRDALWLREYRETREARETPVSVPTERVVSLRALVLDERSGGTRTAGGVPDAIGYAPFRSSEPNNWGTRAPRPQTKVEYTLDEGLYDQSLAGMRAGARNIREGSFTGDDAARQRLEIFLREILGKYLVALSAVRASQALQPAFRARNEQRLAELTSEMMAALELRDAKGLPIFGEGSEPLTAALSELIETESRGRARAADVFHRIRRSEFLHDHGIHVHMEAVGRRVGTGSYSFLSMVAHRAERRYVDAQLPSGDVDRLPILYLTDRIDRVAADVGSLGFTYKGERHGVVVTDAIDRHVAVSILPWIADKPVAGDAHPMDEWVRRALLLDFGSVREDDAAAVQRVKNTLRRHTAVHEMQHTADEEVPTLWTSPALLEQRAYLASIARDWGVSRAETEGRTFSFSAGEIDGESVSEPIEDAPFTALLSILNLYIEDPSFLGPPAHYHEQARRSMGAFARHLGVSLSPTDSREDRLENSRLVLSRLVEFPGEASEKKANLRKLSQSILDELGDRSDEAPTQKAKEATPEVVETGKRQVRFTVALAVLTTVLAIVLAIAGGTIFLTGPDSLMDRTATNPPVTKTAPIRRGEKILELKPALVQRVPGGTLYEIVKVYGHVHRVQKGETWSGIAKTYGLSTRDLAWLNLRKLQKRQGLGPGGIPHLTLNEGDILYVAAHPNMSGKAGQIGTARAFWVRLNARKRLGEEFVKKFDSVIRDEGSRLPLPATVVKTITAVSLLLTVAGCKGPQRTPAAVPQAAAQAALVTVNPEADMVAEELLAKWKRFDAEIKLLDQTKPERIPEVYGAVHRELYAMLPEDLQKGVQPEPEETPESANTHLATTALYRAVKEAFLRKGVLIVFDRRIAGNSLTQTLRKNGDIVSDTQRTFYHFGLAGVFAMPEDMLLTEGRSVPLATQLYGAKQTGVAGRTFDGFPLVLRNGSANMAGKLSKLLTDLKDEIETLRRNDATFEQATVTGLDDGRGGRVRFVSTAGSFALRRLLEGFPDAESVLAASRRSTAYHELFHAEAHKLGVDIGGWKEEAAADAWALAGDEGAARVYLMRLTGLVRNDAPLYRKAEEESTRILFRLLSAAPADYGLSFAPGATQEQIRSELHLLPRNAAARRRLAERLLEKLGVSEAALMPKGVRLASPLAPDTRKMQEEKVRRTDLVWVLVVAGFSFLAVPTYLIEASSLVPPWVTHIVLFSLGLLPALPIVRWALHGWKRSEELARLNEELSLTDDKTGVLNSRGAQQKLVKLLDDAWRFKLDIALISMDMDHLNVLNSFGHLIGDEGILAVVEESQAVARREQDMVSRQERGDEFLLAITVTEAEKKGERWYLPFVEQIRTRVEQRAMLRKKRLLEMQIRDLAMSRRNWSHEQIEDAAHRQFYQKKGDPAEILPGTVSAGVATIHWREIPQDEDKRRLLIQSKIREADENATYAKEGSLEERKLPLERRIEVLRNRTIDSFDREKGSRLATLKEHLWKSFMEWESRDAHGMKERSPARVWQRWAVKIGVVAYAAFLLSIVTALFSVFGLNLTDRQLMDLENNVIGPWFIWSFAAGSATLLPVALHFYVMRWYDEARYVFGGRRSGSLAKLTRELIDGVSPAERLVYRLRGKWMPPALRADFTFLSPSNLALAENLPVGDPDELRPRLYHALRVALTHVAKQRPYSSAEAAANFTAQIRVYADADELVCIEIVHTGEDAPWPDAALVSIASESVSLGPYGLETNQEHPGYLGMQQLQIVFHPNGKDSARASAGGRFPSFGRPGLDTYQGVPVQDVDETALAYRERLAGVDDTGLEEAILGMGAEYFESRLRPMQDTEGLEAVLAEGQALLRAMDAVWRERGSRRRSPLTDNGSSDRLGSSLVDKEQVMVLQHPTLASHLERLIRFGDDEVVLKYRPDTLRRLAPYLPYLNAYFAAMNEAPADRVEYFDHMTWDKAASEEWLWPAVQGALQELGRLDAEPLARALTGSGVDEAGLQKALQEIKRETKRGGRLASIRKFAQWFMEFSSPKLSKPEQKTEVSLIAPETTGEAMMAEWIQTQPGLSRVFSRVVIRELNPAGLMYTYLAGAGRMEKHRLWLNIAWEEDEVISLRIAADKLREFMWDYEGDLAMDLMKAILAWFKSKGFRTVPFGIEDQRGADFFTRFLEAVDYKELKLPLKIDDIILDLNEVDDVKLRTPTPREGIVSPEKDIVKDEEVPVDTERPAAEGARLSSVHGVRLVERVVSGEQVRAGGALKEAVIGLALEAIRTAGVLLDRTPMYFAEADGHALLRLETDGDTARVRFYASSDEDAEPFGAYEFKISEETEIRRASVSAAAPALPALSVRLDLATGALRERERITRQAERLVNGFVPGAPGANYQAKLPVEHAFNVSEPVRGLSLEAKFAYFADVKRQIDRLRERRSDPEGTFFRQVYYTFESSDEDADELKRIGLVSDVIPAGVKVKKMYHGAPRSAIETLTPQEDGFTPVDTSEVTAKDLVPVAAIEAEVMLSTLVARSNMASEGEFASFKETFSRLLALLVDPLRGGELANAANLKLLREFDPAAAAEAEQKRGPYFDLRIRLIERVHFNEFIEAARLAVQEVGAAA